MDSDNEDYEGYYHYLPINDAAISWGVYLTGVGRAVMKAGSVYPPPGHPGLYTLTWTKGRVLPEFQIILISEGEGVFESERTGVVSITAGHAFLLFPGVWHRYKPSPTTGWHEHWISFNGVMTHRMQELDLIHPDRPVGQVKAHKTLAKSFDRLVDRVKASPHQNSVMLSMQAMAVVGSVIEGMAEPGQIPGGSRTVRAKEVSDPLVAETLNLIWTHSDRAFTVKAFANRLAVSRRVLERRFVAELGHSILDEMVACRLSRAKRLLCETNLGVKEVAFISGFPSEERMRVTFNAIENMSPSQYRAAELDRRIKNGRSPESR